MQRDKVNLDIFRLKDESMEDAENLPHRMSWPPKSWINWKRPWKNSGGSKKRRATHLSPSPPALYFAHLAMAYHGCGRYPQAIEAAEEGMRKDENWMEARLTNTAAHEALGHHPQAEEEKQAILDIEPGFSLSAFAETQPYRERGELDTLLEHLRKAGLPE